MPTTHVEENQRFVFGDDWTIYKFDPAAPYAVVKKCMDSKDCDFFGFRHEEEFWLIEVKDFRGYRLENKKRISDGELALEVATKARDTIAGLVGGGCVGPQRPEWLRCIKCLHCEGATVRVVLFLEQDPPRNWKEEQKRKSELSVLTAVLRKHSRWLTTRVLVADQKNPIPGVTVSDA